MVPCPPAAGPVWRRGREGARPGSVGPWTNVGRGPQRGRCAATCVVGLGGPRSAPRCTHVPGVDRWPTVTNGWTPGPCSPDLGSPAVHPIGQRLAQAARVYTATCLPDGLVSESQTGHRLANSGRRSATCRPGCGKGPRPAGSPSVRLREGSHPKPSDAGCLRRGPCQTCQRRGAAAHPPLPLEALYSPPRTARCV